MRIKGNNTIVMKATMPAQQQQGCLHIGNGNNAIVTMGNNCNCNNGNDICALTATAPSQHGQQHKLNDKRQGQ
jgi:hypothetical protein